MEYTEGEWKVRKALGLYHIIAEQEPLNLHIVTVLGHKEAEANANLIAAAPDMYEACLTALGVMATLDQGKGWVKEISGVIQKALSKAVGRK